MILRDIISELKKVRGLDNIHLLGENEKRYIQNNEEKRNLGIFECLKRKYILVLTHDSSFREPEEKIVRIEKNKFVFPGISFSEVKAKKVVSSSPGIKVHSYLIKKFKIKIRNDATLLIGFNLK